jgi:hypothetical protein
MTAGLVKGLLIAPALALKEPSKLPFGALFLLLSTRKQSLNAVSREKKPP